MAGGVSYSYSAVYEGLVIDLLILGTGCSCIWWTKVYGLWGLCLLVRRRAFVLRVVLMVVLVSLTILVEALLLGRGALNVVRIVGNRIRAICLQFLGLGRNSLLVNRLGLVSNLLFSLLVNDIMRVFRCI